jgi:hypothetical protein
MATNPGLHALRPLTLRVQLAQDGVCERRQRLKRPTLPSISKTGCEEVEKMEILPWGSHYNATEAHTSANYWNSRLH